VVNTFLKVLISSPLIAIMILIVIANVNINYQPEIKLGDGRIVNGDLIKELRGLKDALTANEDLKMQQQYPEGYMFLNVIYSLAWCNLLEGDKNGAFVKEGVAEIEKALQKINDSSGREPFSEELSPPFGSFYKGWSTYLLGRKLRLGQMTLDSEEEVARFKQQCEEISRAIQEKVYPVSYYGGAWPADVLVSVASLSLHDKLFEPKYAQTIHDWLKKVKKQFDVNGMIPHSVRPSDGRPIEKARGSSQALMLIFLRDIDEQLAGDQFRLFKEKFIDTKFGLTGIREYSKGEFGMGDVDSGPVIFGFGGAATIVGMQTLSLYGEYELSLKIRNTIEALGFPFANEDDKNYFFGMLPIADAFIAWSHSKVSPDVKIDPSFTIFRIYSLLVFTLLSIFFWILVVSKKSSEKSLHIPW
jgi:hypothetical protein